jgi:hypothetical protein
MFIEFVAKYPIPFLIVLIISIPVIRRVLSRVFPKMGAGKIILISYIPPLIPIIMVALIIISLLDLPSVRTITWQTVNISGVGTFKVPAKWIVEQEDGVIYITDVLRQSGEHSIYLAGIVIEDVIEAKYAYPHELFDRVEVGNCLSAIGFSNNSSLQLFEYHVNNQTIERFVIRLNSNRLYPERKSVFLLVWDNSVDENIIFDIAKSFIPA